VYTGNNILVFEMCCAMLKTNHTGDGRLIFKPFKDIGSLVLERIVIALIGNAKLYFNTDPSAFGLANVTSACITPHTAPYHCKEFREYLFWDGIHPTAAAHAVVAQQVAEALR
jgi:hypothetical protein